MLIFLGFLPKICLKELLFQDFRSLTVRRKSGIF